MMATAEQKERMAKNKREAQEKLAVKAKKAKSGKKTVASMSISSFFTSIPKKQKKEPATAATAGQPETTPQPKTRPVNEQKKKLFTSPGSGDAGSAAKSAAPIAEGLDAKTTASLGPAKPAAKAPSPAKVTVAASPKRKKSPAKKALVDSESESGDSGAPAKDTDATAAAAAAASTAPTQTLGGRRRSASVATSYAEDSGSSGDSDDSDVKPAELKARKQPRKKLKRSIAEDSDDSDGYAPDADTIKEAAAEADDDIHASDLEVDSEVETAPSDADDGSPVKKKPNKRPKPAAPREPSATAKQLQGFSASALPAARSASSASFAGASPKFNSAVKPKQADTAKQAEERQYPWLKDLRDANKNPIGHPDYDPSTLYVPPNPKRWVSKDGRFIEKDLSDFEKQYWAIKKNLFDTILFFKKGKFYEMYGRDAYIGNREMDFKITDRVNMPMVGVPEKTFPMWATKFLGLGYKVARADEAESQLAKNMREKKTAKAPAKKGIISRTLSCVFTQGTLSGEFLSDDSANYIMSIKEGPGKVFGICFCDVGTAEVNISSFQDDDALTQLETILIQIKPKELVIEKGGLAPATLRLLKQHAAGICTNKLAPDTEFWDASKTFDEVQREGYFEGDEWPPALNAHLESQKQEPVSAFGGLMSYFRTLLLDKKIISQGRFQDYDPLKHGGTLMLDGQTLQNLEILENNVDGGTAGTLFELLCHCQTAFGKRRFRRWLCHPLRAVADIEGRYDTIDELGSNHELKESVRGLLKGMPDLERAVAQIHVGTCKPENFVKALEGLTRVSELMAELQPALSGLASGRLRTLLADNGDLAERLEYFRTAFNWREAKEENKVLPEDGADEQYDAVADELKGYERTLRGYLRNYQRDFGMPKLAWHHNANSHEMYQIPIPTKCKKPVPSSWTLKSSTKTVGRYWSPEVAELAQPLIEANETKRQLLEGFFAKMQGKFDEHLAQWNAVIKNLAELDCHLSLLLAKENMGDPMCRPEFVTDGVPTMVVEEMRHPCLVNSGSVTDYIPNNTALGGEQPTTILLTGPNMGGKSTLLRQTCIAVIMAQLGAYIPAESLKLSPVDRIFTRIGANDNIIAGRSTFMVELRETATILNMATPQSLVILDELGRGTSTFDGTAIAHATLTHLLEKIKCRALFATHYHSLTDDFAADPRVSLQHMGCVVEENSRDVTFLYKLLAGVCSKSYGLNVAAMAGIAKPIIDLAEEKAKIFEDLSRAGAGSRASAFATLLQAIENDPTPEKLDELLARLD